MFQLLKTRRGRLENRIENELKKEKPCIYSILTAVDLYEGDNIDTINKLKKEKISTLNKINGALKQSINAHGPITKELIGSASKRIYGSLLVNQKKNSYMELILPVSAFIIGMSILILAMIYTL